MSLATIRVEGMAENPDAMSRVVQGIIQGIMAGISFIGAGVILRDTQAKTVEGLTHGGDRLGDGSAWHRLRTCRLEASSASRGGARARAPYGSLAGWREYIPASRAHRATSGSRRTLRGYCALLSAAIKSSIVMRLR